MNNFGEVNNDILKDWLEFREQETFCNASPQDKEHYIYFEELSANILKNISKENKKYVQKQLDKIEHNFMDYLDYWNEKYYRNGFCDGVEIIVRSIEK